MADDKFELEGKVTKVLKGGVFEVTVKAGNKDLVVTARPSGKLQINHISILLNDDVVVAVTPYDTSKGIIKWRGKK